jgi:hypothetical protein
VLVLGDSRGDNLRVLKRGSGEPDPRHFNYFAVAASFPT